MKRNPKEEIDDPRREILIRALSAGMFMGAGGIIQPVSAMGKIPKVLEPGKSSYDMRGSVSVNGKKISVQLKDEFDQLLKSMGISASSVKKINSPVNCRTYSFDRSNNPVWTRWKNAWKTHAAPLESA